jgi:hypothetical protein
VLCSVLPYCTDLACIELEHTHTHFTCDCSPHCIPSKLASRGAWGVPSACPRTMPALSSRFLHYNVFSHSLPTDTAPACLKDAPHPEAQITCRKCDGAFSRKRCPRYCWEPSHRLIAICLPQSWGTGTPNWTFDKSAPPAAAFRMRRQPASQIVTQQTESKNDS